MPFDTGLRNQMSRSANDTFDMPQELPQSGLQRKLAGSLRRFKEKAREDGHSRFRIGVQVSVRLDHETANFVVLFERDPCAANFETEVAGDGSGVYGKAILGDAKACNQTVLVDVGEAMEYPKWMIKWVWVRVWLLAVYEIQRVRTEISELLATCISVLTRLDANWKLCTLERLSRLEQRQLPHQVVESRAEVCDDLPGQEANAYRDIVVHLQSVDEGGLCGFVPPTHREGPSMQIPAYLSVQRLEVLFRSANFHKNHFNRVHVANRLYAGRAEFSWHHNAF